MSEDALFGFQVQNLWRFKGLVVDDRWRMCSVVAWNEFENATASCFHSASASWIGSYEEYSCSRIFLASRSASIWTFFQHFSIRLRVCSARTQDVGKEQRKNPIFSGSEPKLSRPKRLEFGNTRPMSSENVWFGSWTNFSAWNSVVAFSSQIYVPVNNHLKSKLVTFVCHTSASLSWDSMTLCLRFWF